MSKLDAATKAQLLDFGLELATEALERRAGKRLAEQSASEVIEGIRALEAERVVVPTDEVLSGSGSDDGSSDID